ncbi:PTS sugar transporter subunit IIB [bacterium]|nr:PTS sugar transporter subunit IIB [bacterium]
MTTVMYRVDDRLIHGQIIVAWVPYFRATRIIVADDQLSQNAMLSKILRFAAPTNIRVEILPVGQAVALLGQQRSGPGFLTIVLFASLGAVVQALAAGLSMADLNVGNIRNCVGRLQVSESISLDRNEIDNLRKLQEQGVKITIQPVPTAPAIDLITLMQRKGLL